MCWALLTAPTALLTAPTALLTAPTAVWIVSRGVNTYCSVLQCLAVCCSVLQCVAVCCSMLQCVAVCCSVLRCVAVCCSALQGIAVCCSVLHLQFVAASVFCGVMQYDTPGIGHDFLHREQQTALLLSLLQWARSWAWARWMGTCDWFLNLHRFDDLV